MSKLPLVTVLLPVYNRPHVIETINSILNQSYRNFELLIIDNASTDNTCDVIRSIEDDRIRLLINDTNKGQTYSLNRGLSEAKGKYIARIDSDDISLPERLTKQVRYMEEHSKCVLCGSWVHTVDDDDRMGYLLKAPQSDRGIRILHKFDCAFYHPAVMMRSETIRQYGLGYDENINIAEDYDLWTRIMEFGQGHNICEVLTYYRRGGNNDSKKHEDRMQKEALRIQYLERNKIKNVKLRQRMLGELEVEKKERKTPFQMVNAYILYSKYIRSNLNDDKSDRKIVMNILNRKLYKEFIYFNNAKWAGIPQKTYTILKERMKGQKL